MDGKSPTLITEPIPTNSTFNFKSIGKDKTNAVIKNVDPKKASKSNDIPTKNLKFFWFSLPKF